jgi:hypothetical protein
MRTLKLQNIASHSSTYGKRWMPIKALELDELDPNLEKAFTKITGWIDQDVET